MLPVGSAETDLDAAQFVGRERELSLFRTWLIAPTRFPEILNVSGRAGVGKTMLLRAFRLVALELDRTVVMVDGGRVPPTPSAFLNCLVGSAAENVHAVVDRLNSAGALILLDTFEEMARLTNWLQGEFLAHLATNAKVVVASRFPLALAWNRGHWVHRVCPLVLDGFSPSEAAGYLHRRGIADPDVVEQVIGAAGSNPLALSLAIDVVKQFATRNLSASPEWRLHLRSLAERMLSEIGDSRLQRLLEASATVRQFDQSTLAAVSDQGGVGHTFRQLCQLSIVSPSDHGLMLHDDVRRILLADLHWRRPERYQAMRSRAVANYRERVHSASIHEREWLVSEGLFHSPSPVIQEMYFCTDEPAQVWIQLGQPEDLRDLQRLLANWLTSQRIGGSSPGWKRSVEGQFLEAVVRFPGTRVRTAWERTGRLVGFSTVLPVCRESVELLNRHAAYGPLLESFLEQPEPAPLPETPQGATVFYVLHLIHEKEGARVVRAALLRDLSSLFALRGTYLCATLIPDHQRLLEACGYERIPDARNNAWGPEHPVDGYVLDLSRVGFTSWIDAVLRGGPLPRAFRRAELENELQAALSHWDDDAWLVHSPLLDVCGVFGPAGDVSGPQGLRRAIQEILVRIRAKAVPEVDLALRALEAAYLHRRTGRKQSARSLGVSRATFYRLTQRGIRELAKALTPVNA